MMNRPFGFDAAISTNREVPLSGERNDRPALPGLAEDPANCPLHLAINLIAGRWKLHILRLLILKGGLRYNVLLKNVDGISAKELTRNLRELENSALVARESRDGASVYVLTALGKNLMPAFRALGIFGVEIAKFKSKSRSGAIAS